MVNKIEELHELVSATRNNLLSYNYSNGTIGWFDRCWNEFVQYAEPKGIVGYTPVVGLDFLHFRIGYPFKPGKKMDALEKYFIRSVRLLNDFQEFGTISAKLMPDKIERSDEINALINEFEIYSYEHNHTKGTFRTQMAAVNRFLSLVIEGKDIELKKVTPQDISEFVSGLSEYSKATVKVRLGGLRFFFKFLYENGYIDTDLTYCIPRVQGAKSERIPSTLSENDLERLFSVIDKGSPIGKRDYAVIITAALLGIRDSDIANLTFDNFDWDSKRISIVQEKTKEQATFPILPQVGEAIVDYLKFGRPKTDSKYVFVKQVAPFDKLNSFYDVMSRYMNEAKIKTHVNALRGLHVLRHTLASGLIRQGESYKTVSDILGHVNTGSADVYSHIDIEGLLKCALDVSEVTA